MFTETKTKNDSPLRFMKNKKNDLVVLKIGDVDHAVFSCFAGVCVRTDEGCHAVGYYSETWMTESFEPINGTLEL